MAAPSPVPGPPFDEEGVEGRKRGGEGEGEGEGISHLPPKGGGEDAADDVENENEDEDGVGPCTQGEPSLLWQGVEGTVLATDLQPDEATGTLWGREGTQDAGEGEEGGRGRGLAIADMSGEEEEEEDGPASPRTDSRKLPRPPPAAAVASDDGDGEGAGPSSPRVRASRAEEAAASAIGGQDGWVDGWMEEVRLRLGDGKGWKGRCLRRGRAVPAVGKKNI